MQTLSTVTLVLPDFSEIDWEGLLADTEGPERKLILMQRLHANLLRRCTSLEATPERLAWLSFWSKVAASLLGARLNINATSDLGLTLLGRSASESSLHLHTIAAPFLEHVDNPWEACLDRMRAFAAWALKHDLRYYRSLLDEETLDAIWNPELARSIVANPEEHRFHEALFGELELANEHELDLEKEQMRVRMAKHAARVEKWLADDRLTVWSSRIEELEGRRRRLPSFFELFESKEASMFHRLRAMGLAYGYITYARDSHIMHGSTIDGFLMTGDQVAAPRLSADAEVVERAIERVRADHARDTLLLHLIQQRIWPAEAT
jgi:hypothetical protein